MDSIDIDTLKRSCKANGLSESGTKSELWDRLKGGSGDKKKMKKAAAPAVDTGPPASYVAKEYASLKAAGFDDEEEMNELINKRWNRTQELKKTGDSDAGDKVKAAKNVTEEVVIPVFLTEAQAAKSNLQIKDPTPNDKGMYIYTRVVSGGVEDVKRKGEPAVKIESKAQPAVKIESKAQPDATDNSDSSRKRKWNFEQMDGFHEAAAGWAAKTIESRLMDRKRQKQNLANFCPDFNIPVVEDTKKRWMARRSSLATCFSTATTRRSEE
eukprot:5096767-Prymnesium_polylepis.1